MVRIRVKVRVRIKVRVKVRSRVRIRVIFTLMRHCLPFQDLKNMADF